MPWSCPFPLLRSITASLLTSWAEPFFFKKFIRRTSLTSQLFEGDGLRRCRHRRPVGQHADGWLVSGGSPAPEPWSCPRTPNEDGPAYASVEIPDDTHSLRVVDSVDAPIDCRARRHDAGSRRRPHCLRPADRKRRGSLRPLAARGRQSIACDGSRSRPSAFIGEGESKRSAITLHILTNITLDEVGGAVKIILPPAGERKMPITLAENNVVPVSPGKSLELTLPVEGDLPAEPLIVELTTRRAIQRTAVVLSKEPAAAETRP